MSQLVSLLAYILLRVINVKRDALRMCDGDGSTFSPNIAENNEVHPIAHKSEESYLSNCGMS